MSVSGEFRPQPFPLRIVRQKACQVALPQDGPGVGAVAAGLVGGGDEDGDVGIVGAALTAAPIEASSVCGLRERC